MLIAILVAAVGVFVASSLIHMVLKWHNSGYLSFGNEAEVLAAIGKGKPAPGQYVLPYCADMKQMQSPEMQKKFIDGPVGIVFIRENGAPNMGKHLGQWFGVCLAVSAAVACLCAASIPGAVTRVAAVSSFFAYGTGWAINAIWDSRTWKTAFVHLADAAIYAAVTAASFALLWPKG